MEVAWKAVTSSSSGVEDRNRSNSGYEYMPQSFCGPPSTQQSFPEPMRYQAAGFGNRQGAEHDVMHQGEYGGGSANAECKRQGGREGEYRGVAELAKGVDKVSGQIQHARL